MAGQSDYWNRRSSINRRRVLQAGAASGLGVAALISVGCGDDDDDDSSDEPTQPTSQQQGTQEPQRFENLTAGIATDIGSPDPHTLAGTGGGNIASYNNVFTRPVTVDWETSKPQNFMVSQAEYSPDGLSLVYKVLPGITFHNGEPFDAESMAFSYERMSGLGYSNAAFKPAYTSYWNGVLDRLEQINAETLKIHFKKLDSAFLYHEAVESFMAPKRYITEKGDDEFGRSPVGAGPFKFVSRRVGEDLTMERFPEFWNTDPKLGPARSRGVQRLVQRVLPEDGTRMAALQAGEIDLITNVPYALVGSLKSEKNISTESFSTNQPMMLMMNTKMDKDPTTGGPNPFKDKRVRLAMNHALDIDGIIKSLLTGTELRSYGSSRVSLGHPSEAELEPYKYDPRKAKELLSQAGLADGFETTLYGPVGRWPSTSEVLQAMAGQLAQVGIRARVQQLEYAPYIAGSKDKTLGPLYYIGQATGPDPRNNFETGYRSTAPYASHDGFPEIDALISKSEATFDIAEIEALNKEIMIKFYREAPWVFLWELNTITAWRSDRWKWVPSSDQASVEFFNMTPA